MVYKMINKLGFEINGKLRCALNTLKHQFSDEQKKEILFRLFGFSKVSVNGFVDATIGAQSDKDNFIDFKTNAAFDFNWLRNGTYKIEELTDDPDIQKILKDGLARLSGKANVVVSTAPKPTNIDLSAVEVAIPTSSKEVKVSGDKHKVIAEFRENMKAKLADKLKSQGKEVTDSVTKDIDEILAKYLADDSEVTKALLESNDLDNFISTNGEFKQMMSEVSNLSATEPMAIAHQEHLIRPIVIQFDSAGNVISTNDKEAFVCSRVNMATLRNNDPALKVGVIDRLYRAFNVFEINNFIYGRQSMPMFAFIEVVDANNFIIQSIQPGCQTITLRLTDDETIPLD